MATNSSTRTQDWRRRRLLGRLPAIDRFAVSLSTGISPWQLALVLSLVVVALITNELTTALARYSFARAYILRTGSIGFAVSVVALVLVITCQVAYVSFRRAAGWLESMMMRKKVSSRSTLPSESLRAQLFRIIGRALFVAAVSGTIGAVGNILLTIYGSYKYDEKLHDARAAYYAETGCFAITSSNRTDARLIYCKKTDGSFEARLPIVGDLPPQTQVAIEGLEDRGLGNRLSSSNVRGMGRALYETVKTEVGVADKSTLQGASGIPEQLAALLLDLKPRREQTRLAAMEVKLEKFVGGLRVSDLYKDEVLRLYADLTTYGSVSGYEVKGYGAASRLFYGRSPAELTLSESFELAGRIQNARTRFPYEGRREDSAGFTQRLDRQLTRLRVALDNAVGQGQIERGDAESVVANLFITLRSLDEVRGDLIIPHRDLFLREIGKRAKDATSRFLEIEFSADQSAQEVLQKAVLDARPKVEKQLKASEQEDLEIDAVVVNANGDELAEVGQARTRGDGCSIFKPWLFEQALELGILKNIDSDVMPGLPARRALADSNNEAALKLVQEIGPSRFKALLEGNGFSVVCACSPIALGAGVDSSPLEVAAAFHQFAFRDVGSRVRDAGFIREIRDGKTGEILFARTLAPAARADAAIGVRSALQDTSLYGTAKQLRSLAVVAPVASKTGTSAFFRDGRWQGIGGSWIVASDSRTGVTVVVRMRLSSNRPFQPEAGSSAVLVAQNFISVWRERSTR